MRERIELQNLSVVCLFDQAYESLADSRVISRVVGDVGDFFHCAFLQKYFNLLKCLDTAHKM